MTTLEKLYWQIHNSVEYLWALLEKIDGDLPHGVFAHRKDARDKEFIGTSPALESFSLDNGWRLNQLPFNTCVFASRVLGRSMQDGIRYSVRWYVKRARKLGFIKGDGWSYLRAGNDLGVKDGYLPYMYMPDETAGMSWDEYSKWTPEDDKLLEISRQFRVSAYYQIKNKGAAIAALHNGQVLFTAGKWYNCMNKPKAEKYLLIPRDYYIGGHAYFSSGYRNYGDDFENPQTFGDKYGDNGKAWIDDIFGSNQFAVYVEEHLLDEVKRNHLLVEHENKLIKTFCDAKVYLLENGTIRHVQSVEEMNNLLAERNQIAPNIVPKSFIQSYGLS